MSLFTLDSFQQSPRFPDLTTPSVVRLALPTRRHVARILADISQVRVIPDVGRTSSEASLNEREVRPSYPGPARK